LESRNSLFVKLFVQIILKKLSVGSVSVAIGKPEWQMRKA